MGNLIKMFLMDVSIPTYVNISFHCTKKGSKLMCRKEITDDNNLVTWNMFLVINKLDFNKSLL